MVFQQVFDLRDESDEFYVLFVLFDDLVYECKMQFKDWMLYDIVVYLYIFNWVVVELICDGDVFVVWYGGFGCVMVIENKLMCEVIDDWFDEYESGVCGGILFVCWCDFYWSFIESV